jgi:hypothetical protein
MREDEAKREAISALKNWLQTLSHGDLEPVEDGRPSDAAERLEGTLEALSVALELDQTFVAMTDRSVRSSAGPMVVVMDDTGALIVGVSPPLYNGAQRSFRHRFTWPC